MAGGGSKGGDTTTTQKVELPAWVDQSALSNFNAAQNLATTPFPNNPGQVAPQSADQIQAQDAIRALQGAGTGDYDASRGAITGGGLLSAVHPITADQLNSDTAALFNPYTTAVVAPTVTQMRDSLGRSIGTIGANAGNVGAYGGSRQGIEEGTAIGQESLGEGQLVGGLLSSGWDSARTAAGNLASGNLAAGEWATDELPKLGSNEFTLQAQQAGLLGQSGQTQQQQAQAILDTLSSNKQAEIAWPFQMQQVLQAALGSTPYGTSTTTVGPAPQGPNKATSALGGAATGAAAGSAFGPYGTAIGAVGGGLLGWLGS
jgi:hypothetical protein